MRCFLLQGSFFLTEKHVENRYIFSNQSKLLSRSNNVLNVVKIKLWYLNKFYLISRKALDYI
jgi:hypothetical protein